MVGHEQGKCLNALSRHHYAKDNERQIRVALDLLYECARDACLPSGMHLSVFQCIPQVLVWRG